MAIASSSKKLKKLRQYNILLNGEKLAKTTDFKYLGITIDNCLNFNKHVQNTSHSKVHKIFLLNRYRFYIDQNSSSRTYKTMIQPLFTYGNVIYTATNQKNLDHLQKIQNRGLRVCVRPEARVSIEALHRITQTHMLEDIAEKDMLCFAYKRSRNPTYLDMRPIRTRLHDFPVLKVEPKITTRYQKSVQFRSYQTWSKATRGVKSCESYTKLKTMLKSELDARFK